MRLNFLSFSAEHVEDLKVPPGNRLEKLSGDRRRQHSRMVTFARVLIAASLFWTFIPLPDLATAAATAEVEPCGSSWTLGFNRAGLSFGNSKRHIGLRMNVADRCVERLTGLNLGVLTNGPDTTRANVSV